jgi:RNA-directed DNA polymerase
MCQTRPEAERALDALTAILAELGLELKPAKTRIVHLREGGEGVDFLGFHHQWVRGNTPRSRHLCFLARWPSRQATQRARDRIREITDRSRLLVPVETIAQDVNRFLRGWSGYFRYGNSDRSFDKINHYATDRLARFVGKRHKRGLGLRHEGCRLPVAEPARVDQPQRNHRRAATQPAVATRDAECPPVKNVGEPCAGKSHARFDVGGGRKPGQSARPRGPGASRRPYRHPRRVPPPANPDAFVGRERQLAERPAMNGVW